MYEESQGAMALFCQCAILVDSQIHQRSLVQFYGENASRMRTYHVLNTAGYSVRVTD